MKEKCHIQSQLLQTRLSKVSQKAFFTICKPSDQSKNIYISVNQMQVTRSINKSGVNAFTLPEKPVSDSCFLFFDTTNYRKTDLQGN